MRRGLISWSQQELPRSALDARVDRVRAEMEKQNLGAVIVYASFAQPAPLQWLCNYIPYWSESILIVLPQATKLLVAGTPRTHGWIREVSHMTDLIAAPKVGVQTAAILDKEVPAGVKVGVIGLDALPSSVADGLLVNWSDRLVDASDLYFAARHPCDSYELELAAHAQAIAERAISSIPATPKTTSQVTAAIDGASRMGGAEEVLVRVASDLSRDATLLRIEGEFPMGNTFAVECSMAYRGVWVRVARVVAKGAQPESWTAADAWFDEAIKSVGKDGSTGEVSRNAPGKLLRWTLEASTSLAPLSIVASSSEADVQKLPNGSVAVFSAQMDTENGPWLRAAALRIGSGKLVPSRPAVLSAAAVPA